MKLYIIAILFTLLKVVLCGDSLKIVRGVSSKHQGFYNPDKDFTCLDGSISIHFSSVNDDYCDCPDGSDEPGTSACPNGRFFCPNIGFKPLYLQSSRVNDGICDCCDGSDEYDSSVACFNQCQKFGEEENEKIKKQLEEANVGFNAKKVLITTGKDNKLQKEKRLDEINALLEERRAKLEELKKIKEDAEAPEKDAKDKHQKNWEEIQAKRKEERENIERGEAFALLDTDKDGWVTIGEIMSNNYLETNVNEPDAKDLLGGEAMIDSEKFVDVWSNLKPRFLKAGRPTEEKPIEEETPVDSSSSTEETPDRSETPEVPEPIDIPPEEMDKVHEHIDQGSETEGEDNGDYDGEHTDEDDDKDDEDDDDEEDATTGAGGEAPPVPPGDDEMPEYDEETQKLVQAADEARKNFDEVERKIRDLESEHSDIKSYLDIDFGEEEEFSTLKGECFEYTDREYTYKLCPFDKTTQRSKNGGSETSLGNWGKWETQYTQMKYDNGQACWNGPSRSTVVRLSCGKENQVVTVSEPSRCEYEMEFKTPALCTKVEHPNHTEL